LNHFLKVNATIYAPTKVAVQYNQRSDHTPDDIAGASDRAGFIDAPDINAKKRISGPTIPPMTKGPKTLSPLVYTTNNITPISKAEAKTSIPNINDNGRSS